MNKFKFIVIVLVVLLGLSVGYDIYLARKISKAENETAAEINFDDVIIKGALRDLSLEESLTEDCTLVKIYSEDDGANYLLLIEDTGVYLVGVNFEDGKVHYVDVITRLL